MEYLKRWAFPLVALIIGVGARLYLAANFYGNYDQQSYDIVINIMARGGNVYADTFRYNYAPLWAYILLGLAHIAIWLHAGSSHVVIRGFLTLVDVADALLIARLAERTCRGRGRIAFSAYMLNPVAILLVGYHGQFENLMLLPILGAMSYMQENGKRFSPAIVWVLGTVSLITKHIGLFSVWMLFAYAFSGRRRFIFLALSIVAFTATFLPFLPAGLNGIIHNVFLYSSAPGLYGPGLLVTLTYKIATHVAAVTPYRDSLVSIAYNITRLQFFVIMAALPFVVRDRLKLPLVSGMELSGVALLTTIYGIAEQYFIIPVILGSITLSRPYFIYSAIATVVLLGSGANVHVLHPPIQWHGIWLPDWNLAWLSLVFWLLFSIWQARGGIVASAEQASETSAADSESHVRTRLPEKLSVLD